MTQVGINNAQIVRIFLIVVSALLLYQMVFAEDASLHSTKRQFRKPKIQKRPTQNSVMADQYLKSIASRRTIYTFDGTSTISDTRVQKIVGECLKHTPSAFNTQSSRVIVLYQQQHHRLWELVADSIRDDMGEQGLENFKSRLAGYRSAYGTILFWEDDGAVELFKVKNPSYPFDQWCEHTSGMLQANVWTALELEGLGANLQHYGVMSGFEDKVRKEWNIPAAWRMKAQMPFGKPASGPKEKLQQPLNGVRLLAYGGSADIAPQS